MENVHAAGLRLALGLTIATRAAVWAVAVAAQSLFGRSAFNSALYDFPQATHPFGSAAANRVGSALAHWDAVWYLLIANKTYVGPHGIPAPIGAGPWDASIGFFPGYPMTVRLLSGIAASPGVVLVVAYLVSLLAFAAALYWLYRLTRLELGPSAATWCTVLFALFPGSLFLGAPYAESLLAALSIGCLYAARTGHWRTACVLGGAAALTRLPGVVLVVPLALFYLYGPSGRGPRRPLRADACWLLLVPGALLAYFAYVWHLTGDPLGYFTLSRSFARGFSDPVSAIVGGFRAASHALEVIVSGPGRYPDESGWRFADLTGLIAFLGAAALTVSARRSLPRLYVAYAAVYLLLILCTGPTEHPFSLDMRYVAVLFPVFMELGRLSGGRPRIGLGVATAMSAGLVLVTVEFARWLFMG